MPELKEKRLKKPQPGARKLGISVVGSAAPPDNDENPTHREDFSRLLNVAAKTPRQD